MPSDKDHKLKLPQEVAHPLVALVLPLGLVLLGARAFGQ